MEDKVIGILQPGYIPWLGFFEQVYRCDVFIILDEVQYTKSSWRNRQKIRTRNGWSWLTVPIKQKGRSKQIICDAEIYNHWRWGKRHWHLLLENYRSAPFWDKYKDFFRDVYHKKWKLLVDLDMEIICFCISELGIKCDIVQSNKLGLEKEFQEKFRGKGDVTDRSIFLVKRFGGNVFYEGVTGKKYMDDMKLAAAGIRIEYQDYKHPVYNQQFKPFIPYLSIIDLMLNHGDESLGIIRGRKKIENSAGNP